MLRVLLWKTLNPVGIDLVDWESVNTSESPSSLQQLSSQVLLSASKNGSSAIRQPGHSHESSSRSLSFWYSGMETPQHLACVHMPHLEHKIARWLFLTHLLQIVQGCRIGPGFASTSPERTKSTSIVITARSPGFKLVQIPSFRTARGGKIIN